MAGTTIAMSKLKQVLQWKEEGYSNRKIAQWVYQTPITWTKKSNWLSYSRIINWG